VRYRRGEVPRALLAWLLDSTSLTRRLIQVCEGRFRVRVLAQGRARPQRCEARALGIRAGETALVREVQLLCDGQPWVFARTVIPQSTLRGPNRRLARLGERPLGAVLFADRSMTREPVELARIGPGQALFEGACAGLEAAPAEIWGRRSVFRLRGRPLLVSEIFLPGIARRDAP
jgi:chorismate--pyruvate lyase